MRLRRSVLVIAIILLMIAGCTQDTRPEPPPGIKTAAGCDQALPEVQNGKVIAAYWYLSQDPDDDTYPLVMSSQDQIPWTKINRLYIGFATVKDGELTDLPTGDSVENTTRRAEMQRRNPGDRIALPAEQSRC
jgi:hypothetical protein